MIKYAEYQAEKINIDDFYAKVALVAHNCYQVQGKTPDKDFVSTLIRSNHLAMIEHYVFHFLVTEELYLKLQGLMNKYITLSLCSDGKAIVTTSLRPLLENQEEEVLNPLVKALPENVISLFSLTKSSNKFKVVPIDEKYLDHLFEVKSIDEATYRKHKFVSVKIITDRGVTHELVRHRPCSFAQESTRYCNYSKNKFGNSITLIKPLDYDKYSSDYDKYYQQAEDGYFALLKSGATPDVARALLPNGLKTSIIVTASLEEWNHIFELRMSSGAHPDMVETMKRVKEVIND